MSPGEATDNAATQEYHSDKNKAFGTMVVSQQATDRRDKHAIETWYGEMIRDTFKKL